MTGPIILPQFNEFLIEFSDGFGIRWYALAYIGGLLAGYWILRREAARPSAPLTPLTVDSLLNHVLLGVILGGRLGYVLFYDPAFFLANPIEIIKINFFTSFSCSSSFSLSSCCCSFSRP